jgi:hypothetical protein
MAQIKYHFFTKHPYRQGIFVLIIFDLRETYFTSLLINMPIQIIFLGRQTRPKSLSHKRLVIFSENRFNYRPL